jgi:hypothetical protein
MDKLILDQGLPLWGHDGSKKSLDRGNFLEVYDCLTARDPDLCKANVGVLYPATSIGGTRRRVDSGHRQTWNSKVCAGTRDTRFI